MNKNIFCVAPFVNLSTTNNGKVRLCCQSKTLDKLHVNKHSLEDIWHGTEYQRVREQFLNNEWPKECITCKTNEDKNIPSRRDFENRKWTSIEKKPYPTKPIDFPWAVDLRLGNLCNLKCVMCSPHDSSSWIKEWKLLYPKYTNEDLKLDQSWDENFDYTWYKKGTFLDSMKDQAKYIKELYFAGGEPLMIPEHYNILQFMVDEGYAKDCCVRYNSNGTVLEDKLFVLWSNFKEVTFNFSIDAYSEKNDYIRYPSEWNTIEKNLKILDESETNIRINIASAVQLLNVPYLDELADWKASQHFHKVNCVPFGGGLISTHLVYFPSYLNVRVLPKELKEFTKQRIESFIDRQKFNTEWIRSPMGKRRWKGLVDYMMAEDWTNKLPQLKDYLETLDKSRGTDFRKTFPELGEYI
jgi:MoaA/NifB/PqqE/SkfB family radical SAM enzyme